MDNIDVFNKWWYKNREELYKQREILQAGYFFIAQQAFIDGRDSAIKDDDVDYLRVYEEVYKNGQS